MTPNAFYLRDVNESDLEKVFNWRNMKEIRQLMFNDNELEWVSHVNWFNNIKQDERNEVKLFVEESMPRGVVQYNNITTHGTAEWGFYIGDPYKRGLGTKLAISGLNYAFNRLHIRKLTAKVLSINDISLKFHEKIGFHSEGIQRKQIIRDNEYIDVHLFAQFKEEWATNKITLQEGFND